MLPPPLPDAMVVPPLEDYFLSQPFKISPPTREPLTHVPATLLAETKEDIWYINVCSDANFDYRTVEIPFELADLLPNRNLSEPEWRSLGITQSCGWENFHRSAFEKNILLFRKSITTVGEKICCEEILRHLDKTKQRLALMPNKPVCEMVIFPMSHSWEGAHQEEELHTGRELLMYQVRILQAALGN